MARKNPYDAPLIPSLTGPPTDAQTEVALQRNDGLMPVDDETNFGDIEKVIGSGSSELEAGLMDVDPRALAQRLAAVGAPPSLPTPAPTPPTAPQRKLAEDEPTLLGGPSLSIDPRELAKQLAEQAKARLAASAPKPEPQTLQEDPVALARRLAKEAKERLALAEVAPAPVAPAPVPESETPTPVSENNRASAKRPKAGKSLADRAPRKRVKRSAAEALQAMTLPTQPDAQPEVVVVAETPVPVEARPDEPSLLPFSAPELKLPPADRAKPAPPVTPAPAPIPVAADPAPQANPADVPEHLQSLLEAVDDAEIIEERPVNRANVFRALWEAHQARAAKDGRLELVAVAELLLAKVNELEVGELVGVRFRHNHVEWAAFVDKTCGQLLAIVARPEVYLAGLQ